MIVCIPEGHDSGSERNTRDGVKDGKKTEAKVNRAKYKNAQSGS